MASARYRLDCRSYAMSICLAKTLSYAHGRRAGTANVHHKGKPPAVAHKHGAGRDVGAGREFHYNADNTRGGV